MTLLLAPLFQWNGDTRFSPALYPPQSRVLNPNVTQVGRITGGEAPTLYPSQSRALNSNVDHDGRIKDPKGQPLTEPTVRPATKYFCTKGYSRMMGPVATHAVAIFSVSLGRSVITT